MARSLFLVLVLVVAMEAAAAAVSSSCVETFPVAGLKCKLRNHPIRPGEGVLCPEGNLNTVTFCKRSGRTVRIVGNFAAADLGVCDVSVNPYALPADAIVKYEQYGDQVIFRIVGRASWPFRCMLLAGKRVCVGLGQSSGVSYLTHCVPAGC